MVLMLPVEECWVAGKREILFPTRGAVCNGKVRHCSMESSSVDGEV